MNRRSLFFVTTSLVLFGAFSTAWAKDITTNEVTMTNAPAWLTQTRVEKVTDHIQDKLEWSTRRTPVIWFTSQAEFERIHGMGPMASAVTQSKDGKSTVYLGPTVDSANFDEIFGHEIVHVIIAQKYGDSIPKWLEEGLANHFGKRGTVDYKWLAKQPFPKDVHELAHPFNGTAAGIGYRYKASQALAEMLDQKCHLQDLIRLSVQRHMEDYISNTCEIKDLNQAFRDWVKKKAN